MRSTPIPRRWIVPWGCWRYPFDAGHAWRVYGGALSWTKWPNDQWPSTWWCRWNVWRHLPAPHSTPEALSSCPRKVKKGTLSCREGSTAVLPSYGTWADLSIECLLTSVSWLVTELSQLKEWIYTPFSPFLDPVSVDGDLTTFHYPHGVGTPPHRQSLDPTFKRLLERLPTPTITR